MTVIILERVSPSLRGDLTRWLLEVATGVFVGKISALVRDELWKMCIERAKEGTVLQIWRANNEQGFDLRIQNSKKIVPINLDGLWLMIHPNKETSNDENMPIVAQ
jgi:CRISPR-associated protein Cas2